MPQMIRMGDTTSHGGVVLEGFSASFAVGKPVAGVGHKVACPLCKGVFPIVQGNPTHIMCGVPVAYAGHLTACGATLIPGQAAVHHAGEVPPPAPALCAECLLKAAAAGASTVNRS